MALAHAILAAIADGESSGYDLAKSFDVAVSNFWSATPQQLYRELDRMQSAGYIKARTVHQEKRPDKRLFSLTRSGRDLLHEFTAVAPKPTAIRDDLLVQVEAMDGEDLPHVRRWIGERLATSQVKLSRYRKSREFLLDGRSEADYLAHEPRLGPYLTLARGIMFEQENIRWCRLVLRTIGTRMP